MNGTRLRGRFFSFVFLLDGSCCRAAQAAEAAEPIPLKSGIEFTGPDVRELQADDFANPGMLWVARGEKLWREPAGKTGKSCASCHGDAAASMKGVAARYPGSTPAPARLVNLEGRINLCRERNQQAARAPVRVGRAARADRVRRAPVARHAGGGDDRCAEPRHFERGRDLYHRRLGQMNLVVHALPRPELGQETARRDDQPGPRQRLSDLPAGMAGRRLAAPPFPQLSLRRARGEPRSRLARVRGSGAVPSPGAPAGWRSRRRACAASRSRPRKLGARRLPCDGPCLSGRRQRMARFTKSAYQNAR